MAGLWQHDEDLRQSELLAMAPEPAARVLNNTIFLLVAKAHALYNNTTCMTTFMHGFLR